MLDLKIQEEITAAVSGEKSIDEATSIIIEIVGDFARRGWWENKSTSRLLGKNLEKKLDDLSDSGNKDGYLNCKIAAEFLLKREF